MSLGTFKTLVSGEVNKGVLHDTAIAARIRMAARWFERNYSMRYMHRWVEFTIDSTVVEPRLIVPPPRVKSYEFFRIVAADGTLHYLNKIAAADVLNLPTQEPSRFWLDGDQNLVLDSDPKENYAAEIGYFQYTDWDSLDDNQNPWLVENAEDAMLAQTMIYMAAFLREDNEFLARYQLMRNESLNTIITADEEFLHGASEEIVMEYHGN